MEALIILAVPAFMLARAFQLAISRRRERIEGPGPLSQRLQASNVELARLNRMKSKFLSMAVHDVRTPLASIKGFGELLRRTAPDDRLVKYAGHVVKGAEQIKRLMEDLTDLAVIEAGKLKMDKAPFEIPAMLGDIVPAIELIASQKGVSFTARESRGRIVADRFRITQALMNLLNNAVKFTPTGGRIELKAGLDRTRRSALFTVRDTGPGVHPLERKRIFETFYQSRFSDRYSKTKGLGLGLAIAQEIVHAHHGEIGVTSPGLGKGATFWFRVPAALALALLLPVFSGAQALQEKALLERALETRAEAVARRILGPGRCRVAVNAVLDLTRTQRLEVRDGKPDEGEASALKAELGDVSAEPDELLPGIPMIGGVQLGGPKIYEKRDSFSSAPIKKLMVTVVLDKGVSTERGDQLSKILTDVLDVQPARGDTLTVLRAPFAWENGAATLKYLLLIAFAGGMLWVALLYLKKLDPAPGPKPGIEEALLGPAPSPENVVFDVRPEKAQELAEMLSAQDPENVAVVAAHLAPDVRAEFLSRLPEALRGEAQAHLDDSPRVDPELLAMVKEEVERRCGA